MVTSSANQNISRPLVFFLQMWNEYVSNKHSNKSCWMSLVTCCDRCGKTQAAQHKTLTFRDCDIHLHWYSDKHTVWLREL